jgi:hypothetical protein
VTRIAKTALLLAGAAALHGQMATEPCDTLARARLKISATMQRLPKYACFQTIDRSYFTRVTQKNTSIPSCSQASADAKKAGTSLRLDSTDRVRIDVAESDGREIHSWPDASRFETGDIDELIERGPAATGSFGGYLLDIFDNQGAQFDFAGERSEGSRRILTYTYSVAQEKSHYKIRAGAGWVITAYHGKFEIDAASLELLRITVSSPDLPLETQLCKVDNELNYARARIGDGDFLLPRQSDLHMVNRGTQETISTSAFTNCHEYRAESLLSFGDGAANPGGRSAPAAKVQTALPAGIQLTLRLSAEIDSDVAAAGDLVAATVTQPARDPKSKEILIPAGAVAHGRISRMEHRILPSPSLTIGIAWHSIEIGGVSSSVAANPAPRLVESASPDQVIGVHLHGRPMPVGPPDALFLPTDAKRYLIRSGSESRWVTLAPRAPRNSGAAEGK